MITRPIYASFCELADDGVRYSVMDESMRDYYDASDVHIFVGDVEFSEVDRDGVVNMATAQIDKEIIDLQVAITRKEEKKKQLLAIEYKG